MMRKARSIALSASRTGSVFRGTKQASSANGNFDRELITNLLLSRTQMMKQMMDPRRSINDDCGYPETHDITSGMYKRMYDREPVATRVVQVLSQECWQSPPVVVETEDTTFEQAWADVGDKLRGDNWYKDKEDNAVWQYLLRADELSGIGTFGVLLLGFNDGKELNEPVELRKNMELLFLRAFDESLVEISPSDYDPDPASSRFGQPMMYSITLNNPRGGGGLLLGTVRVHWTRIIHLADNLGSSETIGVPRQRPVWNRLLDLRKLYGGSAEMYWRGAFMGLSIETHPSLGGDVRLNPADTRSQLENYMNGLQRYLALSGVTANTLAPQVVDPTPQIDAQIKAICIRIGIPKRVFEGSERGQLASTQDMKAWNGRLRFRQAMYITPRIIVPFINRLIVTGVLPKPSKGYNVVWPDLDALGADEKATVAVKQTEALSKYVQGGVEAMLRPMEFYTNILGLTTEEATAILEAAADADPILDDDDDEDDEGKELEKGKQGGSRGGSKR
ncbi:hypothetical protein LCGC14_0429100 [marine sediment metagenome]|uniref:Anti-CBASS protein Acb1-like N-terminal domain-containing protein n=1 Tax=marine sediment metagenome TaxID=412755 RepID=A0A0F9T6R6_9ZZZZ